ncbi:MAG: phenylalanine--tRNA ligase beta subunit-related protein [Patescibacteria group bacterium]|nr:hypothetical protein [Patescibacteria group bacterium]
MKIVYSELKKFLPDLKKTPRQVADDLTMLGHFADGIKKTGPETVISLEVRQNRGDCLSYYGIAKDLSVFYQIPLSTAKINLPKSSQNYHLPIRVTARKETVRIIALRLSGIRNTASPQWLSKFLSLHEINSINLLVDLTNYITLLYGIPCHAFDTAKSGGKLVWEINRGKYKKFLTLDGTEFELKRETFLISDRIGAASLVMLGGKRAAIDLNTTETVIEMAVYDRVKVRLDAKSLNIATEAGIRLEKDLDPELIPQAHGHLIQIVLENCGGKISSRLYDYYPKKDAPKRISLDLKKPSAYAGIQISKKEIVRILKDLGCQTRIRGAGHLVVIPPNLRKDISIEEDLIEEIIRFKGYNKIPTDQPIAKKSLTDITPPILYLIEKIKTSLAELGYDEVRSWPLIREKYLYRPEGLKAEPIFVQNSVNEDFPILRMSIISSLAFQKKQYQSYKLPDQQFFEIGRIFYRERSCYSEFYSLGIYHHQPQTLLNDIKKMLVKLGLKHQKLKISRFKGADFIEINLEELLKQIKKLPKRSLVREKTGSHAYELTNQIITLDANIFLKEKKDSEKLIKKYSKKIGEKHLWQLAISDVYYDRGKREYKYTFRARYFNIDDKTAKKLHLRKFGLTNSARN